MLRRCLLAFSTTMLTASFALGGCSSDESQAAQPSPGNDAAPESATTSDGAADDDAAAESGATDGAADSGVDAPSDAADAGPVMLACSASTCPEIVVQGDPIEHDCLGFSPCFVRGHYDPTIEYDAASDTLYLAYTSGTAVLAVPADVSTVAAAHRTHLAKSVDHGVTWTYVNEVNPATPLVHPTSQKIGMLENEVATLVRDSDDQWTLLWLRYFETAGDNAERSEFAFDRKVAGAPGLLAGEAEQSYASGSIVPTLSPVSHVLSSEIPQLADCAAFTEPALWAKGTDVYLATLCLALGSSGIDYTKSRNVLLKRSGDTYEYVGVLLDYDDAVSFGGDSLEQLAIADSRVPGRIVLLATPVDHAAAVPHQGCVALEIGDVGTAAVSRDLAGNPLPLAVITASGGQLGPGLCDYDPKSDTGVLLTIPVLDDSKTPADLRIAIHATGLHP